jgi:hypothetical protein
MSGRKLPAVLRTDTFERPVNQDINTDILRPVQFNQRATRFVFDRKGVLDANSQLNLKLLVQDSGNVGEATGASFPSSCGVLSLIRRAFLTIGGRRVSNLEEVAHYNTWKRLHWSNEYRKGVAIPKQGGADVVVGSMSKDIAADSNGVVLTSIKSRGFDAPYGVLGRESSEFAIDDLVDNTDTTLARQTSEETETSEAVSRQLGLTAQTSPSFVIGLSQLIPFLIGVQLPLFAIREEVALNIEWTEDGNNSRFIVPIENPLGNAITPSQCSSTIVEADCFIMADYLFYPDQMGELADEIMNRGGYDIPYLEVYTQQNFTSYAAGLKTNSYQIAMGGKNVKHIIVQKQQPLALDDADKTNDGLYQSKAFVKGVSYQLQIDSQNFYSRPVSNVGLQKTEADQVEGIPLQLCNYLYSYDGQVNDDGTSTNQTLGLTNRKYNTLTQNLESGNQAWLGVRIENSFGVGKRLSNLPMVYTETIDVKPDDATDRNVRFFVGTQRVLNISQGIVNMIE